MQTISFHIQMQDELPRAEDFGADAIPAATIRAGSMTFRKERELHCANYQRLACCDWKIRFDASPTASLQRQQCCLGSHSKNSVDTASRRGLHTCSMSRESKLLPENSLSTHKRKLQVRCDSSVFASMPTRQQRTPWQPCIHEIRVAPWH